MFLSCYTQISIKTTTASNFVCVNAFIRKMRAEALPIYQNQNETIRNQIILFLWCHWRNSAILTFKQWSCTPISYCSQPNKSHYTLNTHHHIDVVTWLLFPLKIDRNFTDIMNHVNNIYLSAVDEVWNSNLNSKFQLKTINFKFWLNRIWNGKATSNCILLKIVTCCVHLSVHGQKRNRRSNDWRACVLHMSV